MLGRFPSQLSHFTPLTNQSALVILMSRGEEMATAEISMDLPYTTTDGKPYVARITGSDGKYGYARDFVPSRVARGRNNKGGKVTADVAQPGLYEMSDGAQKKYTLVLTAPGQQYLADIGIKDSTAAEIVAAFDDGRTIADIEAVKSPTGKWTCRDAAGNLAWTRPQFRDARADAISKIRALMAEHGITAQELA